MSRPTEHMCVNHPDGRSWQPGGTSTCEYHSQRSNKNTTKVKMSKAERSAADQAAGVIGTDRRDTYGYINGE